jgi:ribosomal protein L31
MGDPERKRGFGRPKHKWEDDIKMDITGNNGRFWTGYISLRTTRGCCEKFNELWFP